ncbi:hypothetical protein [Hyphomicrobium sp. LHD-15]|uniref:hypothetical protein n=1 Tax=Hyphomicrobium sp. LHD-15 TaxID=3072142 RepID=UPI00280C401F|nr:hypothetical protein [Hyphomicrobium sp. LHD-15]MDQ8700589.1 hypothetical protein [Hyphomicrobium sp. LHD-15]
MPEGFSKVSDLKIVISAATGPLQDGIKDAQALIRSFSTDASSGLGALDGVLGRVGGSIGSLAGRLNIAVGALATAGAVIQQVGAVGEKVANSVGAGQEFDAVKSSVGEVQNALLDLASIAFSAVQKEASHAAVSLMGFEASTAKADATADNFAQRTLKKVAERTSDLAQTIRELAPIEQQTYNTLATSLDRIDAKIKAIEASMVSGKKESKNWWDTLKGVLAEYADFERGWGMGLQDQVNALNAQRDVIAKIVAIEKERWTASVATPEADRSLASIEREIRMIEAKAAALNMGAAAAATYVMREKIRQDHEQQGFALAPDGERKLEELITKYTDAQRTLEAGQEAKRQQQIGENRERSIENIFKGMDRDLALEETRARTVGLSADEAKRLTLEESALLQIRLAGREPNEEEIKRIRDSAAARVNASRATAEQSEQLQLLQEHARIAGRALEEGFTSWIRGSEVSWKTMIASMLEDLAMLSARNLVLEPLFGSSKPGDGGGLLGGALTSLLGGLPAFGGQREAGGPVVPGLAYLVGERRPELFIPSSPGTIIPDLSQLTGPAFAPAKGASRTGGEVHVYVHGTSEFDARVVSTAEGVVVRRSPQIVSQAVETVSDIRERRGLA